MSNTVYNVLIPIYANFNILDAGGPLEVLGNVAGRYDDHFSPFHITIAAKTLDCANSKAYEFLTVKPDITFDTAIEDIQDGKFDILIVPGAGPDAIEAAKKVKSPNVVSVCKEFLANDNKKRHFKWMVSICTGALIMAESGCFDEREATTHWNFLQPLKDVTDRINNKTNVVRKRWVDAKCAKKVDVNKFDTRVLSSGGISCGLDASLYLVREIFNETDNGSSDGGRIRAGDQRAADIAAVMDYQWNPGFVKPVAPSEGWELNEKGNISSVYTTLQDPIDNVC